MEKVCGPIPKFLKSCSDQDAELVRNEANGSGKEGTISSGGW